MDESRSPVRLSPRERQPSSGTNRVGGSWSVVGYVLRREQSPPPLRHRVNTPHGGCRIRPRARGHGCRGPPGRCRRSESGSGRRFCHLHRDRGHVLCRWIHRGRAHLPHSAGDEAVGACSEVIEPIRAQQKERRAGNRCGVHRATMRCARLVGDRPFAVGRAQLPRPCHTWPTWWPSTASFGPGLRSRTRRPEAQSCLDRHPPARSGRGRLSRRPVAPLWT